MGIDKKKTFYYKMLIVFSTFLSYVVYLILFSNEPFLEKWINGSFAFFVALVLANIIKRSTLGDEETGQAGEDRGTGKPE